MFLNDEIRNELDYFRRMNEHFIIAAGKSTVSVFDADDRIMYMALSASLAMDISEDGFFEEFIITDTAISGKEEMQIDAYAFIETESTNVKHLHIFQYKLHDTNNKAVSPIELMNFTTLVNNTFVHPELRSDLALLDSVLNEIDQKVKTFLSKRGRKIEVHCHFINNAHGINRSNEKSINDVLGRFEYDKQHHNFKVQIYGLRDIVELAVEGKIRVDSENIDFIIDGQSSYRFEDNSDRTSLGLPKRVFIGICNVNEFIRLQNKYHHNQLYSENIRLYLGDRAAVNKDIINTITNAESIWFPYMNNGISIICDELILGSHSPNKTINIELKNMQIINGCQTVNALYSAKYGEQTQDNFRASNIVVRIYQIDANQHDFKLSVIKATNNQNAVKTFSLLANDPIQVKIAETLKKLDYLYDRKGEAKQSNNKKVISMPNGALAYRAIYEFAAQSLRSRIGQSRVFQKAEYERIYKNIALEDDNLLFTLSSKLLVSSIILDTVRDLVKENTDNYIEKLPIFKKSTYYLSGLSYAVNKKTIDKFIQEIIDLLAENNPAKIRGIDVPNKLIVAIKDTFNDVVMRFVEFYKNTKLDKIDIDNLLKSPSFGREYIELIEGIIGKIPYSDDIDFL
jgi:hypothetical protein